MTFILDWTQIGYSFSWDELSGMTWAELAAGAPLKIATVIQASTAAPITLGTRTQQSDHERHQDLLPEVVPNIAVAAGVVTIGGTLGETVTLTFGNQNRPRLAAELGRAWISAWRTVLVGGAIARRPEGRRWRSRSPGVGESAPRPQGGPGFSSRDEVGQKERNGLPAVVIQG